MPLPPYIKAELSDPERYQTVYSREVGSAAAPTAGLHFTRALLEQVQEMGVKVCYVTLHVGLGTFRPVKEEEITDHEMHSEYCMISAETAETINRTKREGGRVICVGTTSCRTIESWAAEDGTSIPAIASRRWTALSPTSICPSPPLSCWYPPWRAGSMSWPPIKRRWSSGIASSPLEMRCSSAESERKRETGVPTSCGNPGFCMGQIRPSSTRKSWATSAAFLPSRSTSAFMAAIASLEMRPSSRASTSSSSGYLSRHS